MLCSCGMRVRFLVFAAEISETLGMGEDVNLTVKALGDAQVVLLTLVYGPSTA